MLANVDLVIRKKIRVKIGSDEVGRRPLSFQTKIETFLEFVYELLLVAITPSLLPMLTKTKGGCLLFQCFAKIFHNHWT